MHSLFDARLTTWPLHVKQGASTLPNVGRFSKFFHHQTKQQICNEVVLKIPQHLKTCRCFTW